MDELDQYSKFHTLNEVRVDKFKTQPLPVEDARGSLLVAQIGQPAALPLPPVEWLPPVNALLPENADAPPLA